MLIAYCLFLPAKMCALWGQGNLFCPLVYLKCLEKSQGIIEAQIFVAKLLSLRWSVEWGWGGGGRAFVGKNKEWPKAAKDFKDKYNKQGILNILDKSLESSVKVLVEVIISFHVLLFYLSSLQGACWVDQFRKQSLKDKGAYFIKRKTRGKKSALTHG